MDRISILFIKDKDKNSELILNKIKRLGYNPDCFHTTREGELAEVLEKKDWDLIVSENKLDTISRETVLALSNEKQPLTPLIFLVDSIDEETAVKLIRSGAFDYVRKSGLKRLNPTIKKALQEARIRKDYKKTHHEKERLLSLVQKSVNEIYLINSKSFKYEYVNSTALKKLGYTEDEIYLKSPVEINPRYTKEALERLVEPLVRGEKEKIVLRTRHRKKNGHLYPVESHLQLIEQNGNSYLATISFDITDRKNDQAIIKKQRELAKTLTLENKYKSEFLANISHELRTTLDSIVLFSQLFCKNPEKNLTDKQLEYANAIFNLSSGIHELINEVLDHTSIELGKMEINLGKINVQNFCKKIKLMYLPLAKERNLQFRAQIRDNEISTIRTDPIRLEQIVKNLLSNAFKFTQQGKITVEGYMPDASEIKNIPLDDKRPFVAFRVQDTGIGIPEDKQQQIFESFRQADNSIHKKYGGTGLGLAISKEIATLLGGALLLESEPGEGSTFTLYMPKDSTEAVKRTEKQRTTPEPKAKNKLKEVIPHKKDIKVTVLIVDDSAIHNLALKEFLGYRVEKCLSAISAEQAYEILEEAAVDCIILDLDLGSSRGYELITHLKNKKQYSDLKSIIYTGQNLSEKEEKELTNYVDAIVYKNAQGHKFLVKELIALFNPEILSEV